MADVRTESVEYPANGETGHGYLALPEGSGPFPGVIVVQEWWGLDDHIKAVARRFAGEGFTALAPDLYHGQVTSEPGEAQKLMMSLNMPAASKELACATEYLASRPEVAGRGIGAIGFCMGGGLALTLACDSPQIKAVAPFYGGNPSPIDRVANLKGPVIASYAEHDAWITAQVRDELQHALSGAGVKHDIKVYPATEHAFFNDTRPEGYSREAAEDAWQRALTVFRENL
ncbi:MAG TPA: dienelactone hydrolase family protein [Dehalococcoidia bacterium]|nr:dienelactone hydrolase family protein [Dehalococcoidia bacterium]